jgi:hypothetical protein
MLNQFRPTSAQRAALRLETLEDRDTPTVFTVTSLADTIARDGKVTLREAITAAVTHTASGDAPAGSTGLNYIRFNLPGGGVHTIRLTSALPVIKAPLVIDGSTQPGYAGKPLIELDGSAAGSSANGLVLTGGSSTVKGLLINRFHGDGIDVASNNNTIAGNRIGVDGSGFFARGNGGDGVKVTGSHNIIGGTTVAARNVISASGANGVELTGKSATDNTLAGNYIGTDAMGFAAMANKFGVVIQNAAVRNLIGGTTKAARNVIAGNLYDQVVLSGKGTSSNTVEGDYIGVGASGTSAPLSGRDGVRIQAGATNNKIGGDTAGTGNLIGGNGHKPIPGYPIGVGVTLTDAGTTGNVVAGNFIGLDAPGLGPLTNMAGGVIIKNGATGNTIGGRTRTAWNVIADKVNSPGLAAMNKLLGPYWYIDSIQWRGHPEKLGASFAG